MNNFRDDEEERQRFKSLDAEEYTCFIKNGLNAGFTDTQVNWLWENCRNCTHNLHTD